MLPTYFLPCCTGVLSTWERRYAKDLSSVNVLTVKRRLSHYSQGSFYVVKVLAYDGTLKSSRPGVSSVRGRVNKKKYNLMNKLGYNFVVFDLLVFLTYRRRKVRSIFYRNSATLQIKINDT